MFELFPPKTFILVVSLGKRNTFRLKLLNAENKKQYGGEIICLKLGFLKPTIEQIKKEFELDDIIYLTGGNNVRRKNG